jgi:hypothetical protein
MTPEEIIAILDDGDFEPLVGVAEDDSLEFKASPYRLDEGRQGFELAKDVSSLANAAKGGLLVIGFETERDEATATDRVARSSPFARELLNEAQYIDKIRQLIHPLVVGVRVEFKRSSENADRGVAVILVPAQADDQKYFLVAKPVEGPEGAPGWLIGVAVRSFDRNRPLGVEEIHALVSGGRNIGPRLDGLIATVGEIDERTRTDAEREAAPIPADQVRDRVARRIEELDEEGDAA